MGLGQVSPANNGLLLTTVELTGTGIPLGDFPTTLLYWFTRTRSPKAPVPLASDDNIASFEFPVPMGTNRKLRFKVVSSDGGHFGFYQLDLTRQECNTEMPFFDVCSGRCVRFCNLGYWADFAQSRCKRCPDLCVSCVSGQKCLSCRHPTVEVDYLLDPETGRCTAKLRPFWQKKPSRQAKHFDCPALPVLLFLCGLLACAVARRAKRRKAVVPRRGAEWKWGSTANCPMKSWSCWIFELFRPFLAGCTWIGQSAEVQLN